MLRLAMIFVSLMAHAALALPFVWNSGAPSDALELGSGDDQIKIEVGLPVEGIVSTGQDEITMAALDTSPVAASAARQEIKKVEAEPPPELKPPLDEPPPKPIEVAEPEPQPLEPPPDLPVAAEPVDLPPPAEPVEPVELSEARPPELADIVTSAAPVSEESLAPPPVAAIAPPPVLDDDPPPVLEDTPPPKPVERRDEIVELKPDEEIPQPEQAAADAQIPQIPVQELVAAGAQQDGGKAAEALRAHMGTMFRHIQSYRVYPKKKNGRRRTGEVLVAVVFGQNGGVIERSVKESSGDSFVDDAALKWVDKAAPFPAFPKEIGAEQITIDIPFRFTVR